MKTYRHPFYKEDKRRKFRQKSLTVLNKIKDKRQGKWLETDSGSVVCSINKSKDHMKGCESYLEPWSSLLTVDLYLRLRTTQKPFLWSKRSTIRGRNIWFPLVGGDVWRSQHSPFSIITCTSSKNLPFYDVFISWKTNLTYPGKLIYSYISLSSWFVQ